MSLRIFVSSVSREFDDERRALESTIQRLGGIFDGMEYFGSDPRSAIAFDDDAVRRSDLYVGLFGDRYGSIEPGSGKSFTELEYETARTEQVPTLAYFKQAFVTAREEPAQAGFKERVRQGQLAVVFQDARELETLFLIDLFKQIRGGPLFSKLRPQLGVIPFNALHAVTKNLVPEQIAAIGHEKYIPEIYVPRPVEDAIGEFVAFEERFSEQVTNVLTSLDEIGAVWKLTQAAGALGGVRDALTHSHEPKRLSEAVVALEQAFFFPRVEKSLGELEHIMRTAESSTARRLAQRFVAELGESPYVLRSRLPGLQGHIVEAVRRRTAGGKIDKEAAQARSIFPSMQTGDDVVLANDLLKEIQQLSERASKRCFAVVDTAGRGKTNVMCRIADRTAETHPVILLSGQSEFSTQYDIEWHIQRCLESAFGAAFADWLTRSAPALQQERKWLFVVIDAINETSDLTLFARLLRQFLPKLANRRIKLIVSCRDIFWDLFLPSLRPYLFDRAASIGEFSDDEWKEAIKLYFRKFRIVADVDGAAATSLHHPLLLRFFCLAYEGQRLGALFDIHLLSVFNLYLDGVSRNIAGRLGLIAPDAVVDFVVGVARAMWQQRVPAIEQSQLGQSAVGMASLHSIYTEVRSENIVLHEARHEHSTAKVVRFVYDVFGEYALARCWYEDIVAAGKTTHSTEDALLTQAIESVTGFPSALGAIIFLDQLREGRGRLVNRALALSGTVRETLLNARQATLLHALEHIDPVDVDDDLLTLVDRFETIVTDDLRRRVGDLILRLLENNPGRIALRPAVERLLEVTDQKPAVSARASRRRRAASTKPKRAGRLHSEGNGTLRHDAEQPAAGLPTLPPARHHYSEETKLNAIGLIVRSRDTRDYELVDRGIRKLGKMDLHSALHALESIDLAEDRFVYQTIAVHMNAPLPEYRIYCGWLLRERYGEVAAAHVLQLLSDRSTRVHRYSFALFDERQIEEPLIRGLVREVVDSSMPSWLLMYRVKLLGMTTRFRPPALAQSLGSSIVDALRHACRHRLPGIRLAAYRSLGRFPELVSAAALREIIQTDVEARVRSMSERVVRDLPPPN